MSCLVIVGLGNHQEWGVSGAPGALGIPIQTPWPKIRPVLGFAVDWHKLCKFRGLFCHFLAVGTYCGVRRQQRALWHEDVKPHVACSIRFPLLGCFEWVLWPSWAIEQIPLLGPKWHRFGRAHPDLVPLPWAATSEFLAQNLGLARALPRL